MPGLFHRSDDRRLATLHVEPRDAARHRRPDRRLAEPVPFLGQARLGLLDLVFRGFEKTPLDIGVGHRLLDLRIGHEARAARLQRRQAVRVPLRLLVGRILLGAAGARLRQRRLGPLHGGAEEGRIDLKQEVPLLHILPLLHGKVDDPSGDIGRDVRVGLGLDMARGGDLGHETPRAHLVDPDFHHAARFTLCGKVPHGPEHTDHDDCHERFEHPAPQPLFRDPGRLRARARLAPPEDTPSAPARFHGRAGREGAPLADSAQQTAQRRDHGDHKQVQHEQIHCACRDGTSGVYAAHRHAKYSACPNREDVDPV